MKSLLFLLFINICNLVKKKNQLRNSRILQDSSTTTLGIETGQCFWSILGAFSVIDHEHSHPLISFSQQFCEVGPIIVPILQMQQKMPGTSNRPS